MKNDLCAGRLREVLRYDMETGHFYWRKNIHHRCSGVGERAGGMQSNGYVRIGIDGNRYLAHRLAWLYVHGEWPRIGIDHINRIRNDNRIKNLRLANQMLNCRNVGLSTRNKSGHKGISWVKDRKKWLAQVRINGKHASLGRFDKKSDAISAYDNFVRSFGFDQ